MNVLLLRPPAMGENISKVLPLGLLAIGSALKDEGHRVAVLDLRMFAFPEKELRRRLGEFDPGLVGIGLMTVESDAAFALAQTVKSLRPKTQIVFGGPHCAHDPQFILHDRNVDFMVVGEGERTIVELTAAVQSRGELEQVDGLAFRRDGEYVMTGERKPIPNLDALNIDYGLLDVARYFKPECSHEYLPATRRFMPIMTSRGCPYTCIYCHEVFGKTMRYRSPQKVLEEMRYLQTTYGAREFHILDDVFNINMKRAKEILGLVAQSGMNVKISFPNGLRADLIDEELIDKMCAAGVYRLALGIESGSERVQGTLSKRLKIGVVPPVVRRLSQAGISVNGFFMLGFPGETREEMEETIRFACDLDLSTALFSLVIPNPGTKLRTLAVEEGAQSNQDFSDYSINAVNGNASRVEARELIALQKKAYRKFYLSPRRMWKVYRTTPAKSLLAGKFFSFLKLAG